jgi:uncharacterized coiled-coil protein SlyX
MRISKRSRNILIESVVGVAATLGIAAACGVPDLGVGMLAPHPVWLVVLVMAARYGVRGLIVVMTLAWGGLAALAVPSGFGALRTLDVLATTSELGALAAAVLVAWIASAHERRQHAQAERLAELEQKSATDSAAIDELRNATLALRSRSDRLDMSLTFLRDVAHRLDGSDANAASEAALELVVVRLGARAAAVQMLAPADDGTPELTTTSSRGIWNPEGTDGTAAAALRTGRATRALDLRDGSASDSDVAAPVMDATGAVRGVLVARGLPGGGVGATAVRDLGVIADWLAPVLTKPVRDRDDAAADAAADDDGRSADVADQVIELNA